MKLIDQTKRSSWPKEKKNVIGKIEDAYVVGHQLGI